MNKELLKLALCAVMTALPLGAWADEAVISSATTWTFGDYAVSDAVTTGINEITVGSSNSGLYNRSASSGRGFQWQTSDISSVTFMDGTQANISIMAVKLSKQKVDTSDMKDLTAAQTTISEVDKKNACTAFFTFNTTVAGTCYAYVKNGSSGKAGIYFGKGDGTTPTNVETNATTLTEIQLTSTSGGTFFVGGKVQGNDDNVADTYIYAIRFVPLQESVGTATTLSFDHFKTSSTLSQLINAGNGFYVRGTTSSSRYFTLTDNTDEGKPYTFADGTSLAAEKYIELNSAIGAHAFANDNDQTPWTTSGGSTYPAIAFKNSVAGKICVIAAKGTSESNTKLAHYYKSNGNTQIYTSVTTTPTEYTWDVAANEVNYISAKDAGGLRIYGVRFIPTYTLTTTASPVAGGSIAGNDGSPYIENTNISLTATPNEGYRFDHWSGDATGSDNPLSVTMSADKSITANFVQAYTLTTNITGKGSITRDNDAEWYDPNTVVKLTAIPAEGYKFVNWTGTSTTTNNPLSVTMDADKNYTANFTPYATTSIWNFDQYAGKDVAQINTKGETKGVVDYNGLYFHYNGNRTYKDKIGNGGIMALYNASSSGGVPTSTTSVSDATADIMGIAYETPGAGDFYVTVYISGPYRDIMVYSNGTKSNYVLDNGEGNADTYTYTIARHTLKYSATGTEKIYIIPSGGAMYFEEFKYVPTVAESFDHTINISAAGMSTFSSTHNYKWSDDNLKAYRVASTASNTATLVEISKTDGIPACTGVIFMAPEGTYTLTSAESVTAVGTNQLKANIVAYQLPENSGTGKYNYILTASGFVPTTGTGNLAAGRAYLQTDIAPGTSSKLEFIFGDGTETPEEGEETDGISSVEAGMMSAGAIYDLSGRRVVAPTKGLYIVNGKKIVIK